MDVKVWDDETRQRYYDDGYWDALTLAGRVAEHARERPHGLAFVGDDGVRLTWGAYDASSAQLGAVLSELVPLHAPVGTLFPDSPAVHVAYLAAERAGNVAVGIGPRSGTKEIAHLLDKTGAEVLVTARTQLGTETDELVERVSHLLGRPLRHVVLEVGDGAIAISVGGERIDAPSEIECDTRLSGRALGPDDLFFINSTSGTTGLPKCVMHSQNRWKYFHSRCVHFRGDDVFMVVVPQPFGFGLWMGHFSPTLIGAPTVLVSAFDVEGTIETAARERVSVLAAVSSQVVMMVASPLLREADLSPLRFIQTGGERVPYDKAVQFEDITGSRVMQFYGSNEAGCVSGTTADDSRERRLRTAGRVIPEMHARLFAEDGTEVTATGGPGQCACKGPGITPGYFGDPKANEQLFRPDGWMLLGDIVEVDGDGYLSVIGRTAEFIIRGGRNISAAFLEEEIGRHPKVAIAGVVGVADEVLGERVCAFVVTHDGAELSLADLTTFLEGIGVTKETWPEAVITVPALAPGAGGKIGKAALREEAEARRRAGSLVLRARDADARGGRAR